MDDFDLSVLKTPNAPLQRELDNWETDRNESRKKERKEIDVTQV